jgi:hypothetical protein
VYGPEELLGIASVAGREFEVAADDERRGSIEVLVAGSPGLVDAHVDKALAKARSAN